MNIKDFLAKHPEVTAMNNGHVNRILEKVEKMALDLNTLDNMALGLISRAVGIETRRPDRLHPHYHIFLTHERGGIFLQGPVMKANIQFDEL